MSSFNNNGVTLKGAVIIASLVAGGTLTFTRIVVGDGVLPAGQSVLTTEKLVNPLFNVPIASVESDSVAHATVKGIFSNADLGTGFYYRELGLYAINPVTKAEELFCYGNAGDEAEWINPAGESSLIEKEIHLVTLIGGATNVTANFDPKAPALKSEMDKILPSKADLDATPENGGRVLAEQMRFDAEQILYVDAAAAAGGDGSEAKPFKTIAAAISARYMGAGVVVVKIAPGTYNENIATPLSPGTAWVFERNGTGTVSVLAAKFDILQYCRIQNITLNPPSGESGITITHVGNAAVESCTINGNSTGSGISLLRSLARINGNSINNTSAAIFAGEGAEATVIATTGTGNSIGAYSDSSIICWHDNNTVAAGTKFKRTNGGAINPASWQVISDSATDITKLDTGVYTLKGVDLGGGLPGDYEGTLIVDKQTATPHMIFFYDIGDSIFHRTFNPSGVWNNWRDYIPSVPQATAETFGLMRVAAVEDEQDCQCEDAAITPANLYDLNNYRKASTAYKVGDVVACPYHAEFMLKCTQAGTTSTGVLDTTSATLGKIYTDGGVKWEVIVLPIELGGTGATTTEKARKNLNLNIQTFKSLSQIGLSNNATWTDIYSALPNGSQIMFEARSDNTPNLELPYELAPGTVFARKSSDRMVFEFFADHEITYKGILIYYSATNISVKKWKKDTGQVGEIVALIGNKQPSIYTRLLPCNGAAVSRTNYDWLFVEIGTSFGEGDGSTTFNLPNFPEGLLIKNDNPHIIIGDDSSGIWATEKGKRLYWQQASNMGQNMYTDNSGFLAGSGNAYYDADLKNQSVVVKYYIRY